ncbi:MAG TPA: Mu transposase C-terminal domain-containing protein [Streptosporangiaceae bacterium]|nr:Mu transposase C-terminal domain-containing protein [Streptosporangiaceae bacterium]
MSGARRRRVGVGDRILVGGTPNVVVSVTGTRVRLADDEGAVRTVTAAELADGTRFEIPAAAPLRGPRPETGLEGLPAAVVGEASWWEAHIAEVVYGLRPDAPAGTRPRPHYDPERTSLSERERAKAAELSAAGRPVPASTVKHRRQRWEAYGLPGLADRRLARRKRPAGRADDRVVAAMRQAIGETARASSRTAGFVIWRTREILAGAGYDGPVPSDRTFYRLFGALSHGRQVTGSASTRRSLAGRPEGMFGSLPAAAPGEVVQIDSTPLDVLVLLDDGVPGRVELTGMIDVATRVVPAAVLRPTTRAVDASVLLARALTPEPARPGWPEALKMAHSVLPYQRLLDIDARLEHAAARPVIVPDTIVIDHGSVFVSAAFRSACRHLGISIQPAHLGSGSEKGHIERYFGSVASLFCQFASGYAGRSPDRRGRHVEDQPLWSMAELQELLDEWLIAFWLNRPHDGLRDPEHPGRAFTPNEKYAALVEAAGYVPVALGPDDYIELLPASWRAVNAYGIKLARRSYDSAELNPLRLQPSGVREKKNLHEVRHDPYDVSRIHVRGTDGWITVFWKHLDRAPVPFGELAWDHVRRSLGKGATEEQIADAVAALLRRANAGPDEQEKPKMSKRDRRVAARTKAAAPAGDQDQPEPAGQAEPAPEPPDEEAPLAKVIPMKIFDPFAEADKRW